MDASGVYHAADLTAGNINALPGAMVRVGDLPAGTETAQSFSSAGGFFRESPKGWAGFAMSGVLSVPPDGGAPGLNVLPGATITLTAEVTVTAPAMQCSGTPTPTVGVGDIGLLAMFDGTGRPLQPRTWLAPISSRPPGSRSNTRQTPSARSWRRGRTCPV